MAKHKIEIEFIRDREIRSGKLKAYGETVLWRERFGKLHTRHNTGYLLPDDKKFPVFGSVGFTIPAGTVLTVSDVPTDLLEARVLSAEVRSVDGKPVADKSDVERAIPPVTIKLTVIEDHAVSKGKLRLFGRLAVSKKKDRIETDKYTHFDIPSGKGLRFVDNGFVIPAGTVLTVSDVRRSRVRRKLDNMQVQVVNPTDEKIAGTCARVDEINDKIAYHRGRIADAKKRIKAKKLVDYQTGRIARAQALIDIYERRIHNLTN